MDVWRYEIRDGRTRSILKSDSGFKSEEDALCQARMEIQADGIIGCYIVAFLNKN